MSNLRQISSTDHTILVMLHPQPVGFQLRWPNRIAPICSKGAYQLTSVTTEKYKYTAHNRQPKNSVKVVEKKPEPVISVTAESEISRVMTALGQKGEKINGKKRLNPTAQKRRSRNALRAALSRWNNQRSE